LEAALRVAVCPGSFDPVTHGHVDIISRAAVLFDQVIVAVLVNDAKHCLFPIEDRIDMLRQATAASDNVDVRSFAGLLVDFCVEHQATAVVKGVRAASDFDYELPMAQMNASLKNVETVLLTTSPQWSFVSSSLVKEVARFGGDVSGLVPSDVLDRLNSRLQK
jgi:pantetheine-phosphate adenylyltransferase